jgi:hypothetical protein
MKHIQPFALFESESPKRDLSDILWDLLVSRVTFPELCKNDTVAWASIIDLYSHDEYLESYENNFDEDDEVKSDPMEEEEYSNLCFKYRPSDDQMAYDDFMKCLHGYSDWCEEHRDEPLEWYMERFGVSRGLGMILKVWNGPDAIDPNGSIELWSAMDEFPEVFQPILKDRVDELIANWNSRIANEVRTKAPSLWKEVIKAIDPTEAETSADLGDLGF